MRGGHRSTATRIIAKAYEVIESTTRTEPDLITLTQCKHTLEDKLEIIKRADGEILDLVQEDEVENKLMCSNKEYRELSLTQPML